jgi:hypothetical protein
MLYDRHLYFAIRDIYIQHHMAITIIALPTFPLKIFHYDIILLHQMLCGLPQLHQLAL